MEENSFRRASNIHLGFADRLSIPTRRTGQEVNLGVGYWSSGVCIDKIADATRKSIIAPQACR